MTHPFPCSQLFPTWTGSRVRTTPFQSRSCSKETAQIRLQRLGGVPGKNRMTEAEEAGLRGLASYSHHSIWPSRLHTAACYLVTQSGRWDAWELRPLLCSAHSAPSRGLPLSAPDARWPVEGTVCKPMALFSVCPMQRKAWEGLVMETVGQS